MAHSLVAKNVSKKIKGKNIIHSTSFKLEGGYVYGLVGENGSGKTMLIRMLCGLVRPSTGEVLLDGIDIHKKHKQVRMGVIIENSSLWPELTGLENLELLASLNCQITKQEIKDTMMRVGLDPENRLPIRKYSLGMRQRLIVAQAIMERPDFLFLDEPTNSIDREGVLLTHKIIEQEAERGAVILLASHINQDISNLCAKIFFVNKGYCSIDEKGTRR